MQTDDEVPDMMAMGEAVSKMSVSGAPASTVTAGVVGPSVNTSAELELEVDNMIEADDPSAIASPAAGAEDNIVRTRTYDVSITYDKYEQLHFPHASMHPSTPVCIAKAHGVQQPH